MKSYFVHNFIVLPEFYPSAGQMMNARREVENTWFTYHTHSDILRHINLAPFKDVNSVTARTYSQTRTYVLIYAPAVTSWRRFDVCRWCICVSYYMLHKVHTHGPRNFAQRDWRPMGADSRQWLTNVGDHISVCEDWAKCIRHTNGLRWIW